MLLHHWYLGQRVDEEVAAGGQYLLQQFESFFAEPFHVLEMSGKHFLAGFREFTHMLETGGEEIGRHVGHDATETEGCLADMLEGDQSEVHRLFDHVIDLGARLALLRIEGSYLLRVVLDSGQRLDFLQ